MSDNKDISSAPADEGKEIDLLELVAKLWGGRRTIVKYGCIAAVLGLVVAFSIPKEYTTTIKLAAEANAASGSGSLGALAAMAGLNTSSAKGGDAVVPQLYADVLSSVPFMVGLFDVPVTESKTDSTYTVRTYMTEHQSAPWWSVITGLPSMAIGGVKSLFTSEEAEEGDGVTNPFKLTREEMAVKESLKGRISCDFDQKTGVNTISVTMQDPLVSATLADTVATHLQQFITDYRTSKARKDLAYAEKLNEEARKSYYDAQQRLAQYLDRNQGLSLHSAQVTRDRLSNEAQLAFSLFNQTAQQLQLAKAKVQENTPVYAVVEPATVPVRASKPSKIMILVGFVFLGVVAASVQIIFADSIEAIKTQVFEKKS